jgi:glycerophosphoryl diester phosphodiesterase
VCAKPLFDRPIAHRGLHDIARGVIENSFSAFEAAVAGGYAIECDVQLSSDGVPYIFHDDELERLTGAKGRSDAIAIADVTALRLLGSTKGETPQRFTEFLEQVSGRTLLQIEVKQQSTPEATTTLAETVTHALSTYRGPQVIESFDPNLLVAMRRAGYRGKLGIITYGYDVAEWETGLSQGKKLVLRHLLHWPLTRFSFISCLDKDLGLPAVKLFRALGLPVTAWTIRTADQARGARAGADQIVFEGFAPA